VNWGLQRDKMFQPWVILFRLNFWHSNSQKLQQESPTTAEILMLKCSQEPQMIAMVLKKLLGIFLIKSLKSLSLISTSSTAFWDTNLISVWMSFSSMFEWLVCLANKVKKS
jgi:hypothetical protein